MSRIFWTFVTLCVIVGVIAAIAIPSLSRARISSTPTEQQGYYNAPLYLEGGGEYVPYEPRTVVVHNTEDYDPIDDNTFKDARLNPLSTFSIDVDTASYSNVGDVPAAVEFGRVAAAPVNTLRQQTHRCQEISVCF